MSIHPEKQPLEIRIERLERQNRLFRRGALTCLIALVSVGLMGQTKHPRKAPTTTPAVPEKIEAGSFIMKDSSGKIRATLSMAATGPALKLLDENGTPLMTLSLNDGSPQGPMMLLSGPQHRAAFSLSVLEGMGSQLSLVGARPDIQARMEVAPEGTSLEMSDADGFTTSIGNAMQASKGKPKKTTAAAVTLYGKDRKVLWSTP
jgi:hypothetical protein